MEWINWVGLVLNFVGALMIAISIGRDPGQVHTGTDAGRNVSTAAIYHPRVLRSGLGSLVLGFLLQIVAAWPG